jgi:FkbM family methyltransferase
MLTGSSQSRMSFKDLFNPMWTLAARVCERSPRAAGIVRNLDFRGKPRIVQRIRPNVIGPEVFATCDGVRYKLDLRDDIQRELYFNIYERNDLRLALDLIPKGGTCIDIGANSGAFALHFAKKVGPRGRVHAYEPEPANFSRLIANCRLNGFENVLSCHRAAVSNINGTVSFYGNVPGHSGWGSLVRFGDLAAQAEQVDATTLDRIIATEHLETVDLLKVDIEAHEPELLAGGANALAQHKFRFILIEFNGIRLADRRKTLEDFLRPLREAGYAPFKLRTELMQKMLRRTIPPETVVTNFLFAAMQN